VRDGKGFEREGGDEFGGGGGSIDLETHE